MTLKNVDVVITHGNCVDGILSGIVAKLANPDAIVIPASDRKNLPEQSLWENKNVLITDFSYPRELMQELDFKAKSLLLLDHHETAEHLLGDLSYCKFCMEKSGCQMTWDHFFPGKKQPLLLKIAGEADRGIYTSEHAMEVLDYAYALPFDPDKWLDLMNSLEEDLEKVVAEGRIINTWKSAVVDNLCGKAFQTKFNNEIVWALNTSLFKNETAHKLMHKGKFSIIYTGHEGKWYWSLRSDKTNVAKIAEKHGGGGHKGAAAFVADYAPTPITGSEKWKQ